MRDLVKNGFIVLIATLFIGTASAAGFDISGTTLETDATSLVTQAVTIALAVGVAVVGLVLGMHILKMLRGAA